MAIMSLKFLHTMEGNSSDVILYGLDFLKLQSETQSEVREQKTKTVTYNVIYSFVKGYFFHDHIDGKSVLSYS